MQVPVKGVDEDLVATGERAAKKLFGKSIFKVLLDRPAQRPGAVLRVVALIDDEVFSRLSQFDLETLCA